MKRKIELGERQLTDRSTYGSHCDFTNWWWTETIFFFVCALLFIAARHLTTIHRLHASIFRTWWKNKFRTIFHRKLALESVHRATYRTSIRTEWLVRTTLLNIDLKCDGHKCRYGIRIICRYIRASFRMHLFFVRCPENQMWQRNGQTDTFKMLALVHGPRKERNGFEFIAPNK